MDFKRISPIDAALQNEYEHELIRMLIGASNELRKKDILRHCCAEMFTNLNCRQIFKAAAELEKEQKELNIANLIEKNQKEAIKQLIIDLSREYITAANYKFYAEKIAETYINKMLAECTTLEGYKCIELIKRKYSFENDTAMLYDNADTLMLEYYNRWGTAVQTYYPSIDKALGSLLGGDMLVLAGATGMGKTCMMLNLVRNMALKGKKILLISLEMSLQQLQNRIISAETNLDASKIRSFSMTDDEMLKYYNFSQSESFKKWNVHVCTTYNITAEKIKLIVNDINPDIVFIDYLGLVSSEIKGNAYERVSQVSRDLKLAALDTNTPFIVLHQLSRIGVDRKEKRPLLSDLRDSGKIEQDADFICFVFREAYYNTEAPANQIEFIISKSRHGEGKAKCLLKYDGAKQLIEEFKYYV